MSLCQRCTSAVQQLFTHRSNPGSSKDVIIQFPVLRQADVHSCWICLKFSKWLEATDPTKFGNWNTAPTSVKYHYFGEIVVRKRNLAPRLFLLITLHDKNPEEEESFMVDLAFIRQKGTIIPEDKFQSS
jgi:hypothetical protein